MGSVGRGVAVPWVEHGEDGLRILRVGGHPAVTVGQHDGDGLDDLLIGAPKTNQFGSTHGATDLFFGSSLAAERTALNFLGRTSGIATHTRRFVNAVAGTGARIVDTRKTLPGWRSLDKYATAIGGGVNHRMGLYDGILLKDNHVAAAGGVELAVKNALSRAPAALRVQVEVENLEQARAAVEAGADFLLLDNMSPRAMREVVDEFAHRAILEATGGVGLENVREIADTGVHRISIGALTHSAPSADVARELADDSAESDGGSAPWGVPR